MAGYVFQIFEDILDSYKSMKTPLCACHLDWTEFEKIGLNKRERKSDTCVYWKFQGKEVHIRVHVINCSRFFLFFRLFLNCMHRNEWMIFDELKWNIFFMFYFISIVSALSIDSLILKWHPVGHKDNNEDPVSTKYM